MGERQGRGKGGGDLCMCGGVFVRWGEMNSITTENLVHGYVVVHIFLLYNMVNSQ